MSDTTPAPTANDLLLMYKSAALASAMCVRTAADRLAVTIEYHDETFPIKLSNGAETSLGELVVAALRDMASRFELAASDCIDVEAWHRIVAIELEAFAVLTQVTGTAPATKH